MRTGYRTIPLLAVFCLALGCSDSGPESEPDTAESLAQHMQDHFEQVTSVRTAIINGDLEAARAPAQWLAEHQAHEGLGEEWHVYVERIRQAARRVIASEEFDAAGYASAQMAVACGECHEANHITGQFSEPDPYSDEETVAGHMSRHIWAVDQMWKGMLGPSDEAWSKGVERFIDVPLVAHESVDGTEYGDRLRELANRVHGRAAMGFIAETPEERALVYGEIIATCATCHDYVRGGGS